jgi:fatty-acyl-CoA synthase
MSESTSATTLVAAIEQLPVAVGRSFTFVDAAGAETAVGFPDLHATVARRHAQLAELGVRRGDRVAVVLPDAADFVPTFLGAVRGGAVPVPLYPPVALGRLDAYLDGLTAMLRVAAPTLLCTGSALRNVLASLLARVPSLRAVVAVDGLPEPTAAPAAASVTPDETALLQFTSGSTAHPKGVVVPHGSLAANAEIIMRHALGVGPEDSGLSWLPLHHDMGLIGFVLAPIFVPTSVTFLPTLTFLRDPQSWFDWIDRKRATISFAPNFAYARVRRRVPAEALARWDLSCVRVLGCGAEPISADTMRAFVDTLSPAGLRPQSIVPCYGMAEATLAMAFASAEELLRVDAVDATAYRLQGEALPVTAATTTAQEFVSCGRPGPAHQIAVVDEQGRVLPERVVGELVFRGPSVTRGYFGNIEATRDAVVDGWLRTGDLGYLAAGEVYVTGRKKDVLVIRGRNADPQQVEWAVESVSGIRAGNVAAFTRPGGETEELVVAVERTAADADDALAAAVARRATEVTQLAVADVVLLRAGDLPKTSSGKVQRARTRELYLAGDLGAVLSPARTVA